MADDAQEKPAWNGHIPASVPLVLEPCAGCNGMGEVPDVIMTVCGPVEWPAECPICRGQRVRPVLTPQ